MDDCGMTLGSLFDGSGGFPLAGVINGIDPIWASEIEPYPLRVTAARFPNMKQHGDVTKINGAEIEPVDIITFGSPCQDLSISGLRKGIIEGSRSNLFFEAIRIIKEMRDHDRANGRTGVNVRPRFAVFENVFGAFSSNHGEDFRCVLEAFLHVTDKGLSVPMPKGGKWLDGGCVVADGTSIAWRVYDAQVWLPQRRKRIYLVADFAGERAGEILFEQKGLSGHTEPSIAAWKEFTKAFERCSDVHDRRNGLTYSFEVGLAQRDGSESRFCLNICPTLRANAGDNRPAVALEENGKRPSHKCDCHNAVMHESSTEEVHGVTYPVENHANDSRVVLKNESDPVQALTSSMGTGGGNVPLVLHVNDSDPQYIVRRLTPLECCRLQGFPDWWEEDVEGSEYARYKMWGNGIALPCAVDVLYRIKDYLEKENATNEKV